MSLESITYTLRRPDDWHVHLRDGVLLPGVLAHTAAQFARAIVMPNLKPAVTTTQQALDYKARILKALAPDACFTPLMTLYLTDHTTPAEIKKAKDSAQIFGIKLYPAGATTHSDAGVTKIKALYPTLEMMQTCALPLLVHGESTDPEVDIFDREAVFIDKVLIPLRKDFPELKIVLEHITTAQAVLFVCEADAYVAATVTPQHILLNRNALFKGGLRVHHYCLPVLKRETHRSAIMNVLAQGHPRFFLGTDSAPHARENKESDCGCAGIFSAHAALELYAEAFAEANAMHHLEGFASLNGPRFYGLKPNTDYVTLRKQSWSVPHAYQCGDTTIVPLKAGEEVTWKLQ